MSEKTENVVARLVVQVCHLEEKMDGVVGDQPTSVKSRLVVLEHDKTSARTAAWVIGGVVSLVFTLCSSAVVAEVRDLKAAIVGKPAAAVAR